MKVLVTGANGFLGSWLTRRLVSEGLQVRVLVRPSSDLEDIQDLPVEKAFGDVTDLASLIEATKGVDSVFHLAGLIAYAPAQRPAMNKVNVLGTDYVVRACHENKVRRLLHLSSVVAVGASFDETPLNESSPYNVSKLNLGYFETKHAAEQIVLSAVARGEIDAVMVNPSTIYGPGDAKKGSRGMQLKVARGKMPFYTNGGVSIVAIEDAVDAIIAAWRLGRSGERYIISGENIRIKKLFELIASEAGVKPPGICLPTPVAHLLGKIGDMLMLVGLKGPLTSESAWTATLYHWFDSSKAQRELGFHPRPAREAIASSVKWVRDTGRLN